MKNSHLNLGDLIRPEKLEKPGEGVLTVELGAAGEKIENLNKLGEAMSDFARTLEDNRNIQVSDVARLVEVMKNAMKRELLPEKAAKMLTILKKRFEAKDKHYKSAEGIKWEDVRKKLEDNPEKLWSLNEMERTGGAPDLVEIDRKTGEYIFMDCSAESPEGRRNCVYDREGEEYWKKNSPTEKYNSNAVGMAALMGLSLLTESEYRDLQTKGEFDKTSFSWLKTPVDKRKAGVALSGRRFRDGVGVVVDIAHLHVHGRAFRASLRV
jgi:hypothetical protein